MTKALARLCAALALLGAGCSSDARPESSEQQVAPNWREIATPEDRERLRGWRTAWTRALEQARASGHGPKIAAETTLLDPDAALGWEAPPPGTFRCRTIKIGAKSEGMLDFVAYPAFDCRLRQDGEVTRFVKTGGSQRPVGRILPYSAERMVFLGTLQLGDETRTREYGRDKERDLAAFVERIGERRWRLVFPYPHFESNLDVIELVPQE
jgi:hypothetical protein